MNNSQLQCHWPWFDLSMTSKVKFYQVNWKAIYDLLYVFLQTFIIRCIVSEILAEIDHKGQNWTFLTLKMTLEWFHTFHILGQDWFHNKKATWCNKFGQHFVMGKWAKPDLSDLENDLLNNSIQSISWQLINIIP